MSHGICDPAIMKTYGDFRCIKSMLHFILNSFSMLCPLLFFEIVGPTELINQNSFELKMLDLREVRKDLQSQRTLAKYIDSLISCRQSKCTLTSSSPFWTQIRPGLGIQSRFLYLLMYFSRAYNAGSGGRFR